MSAMGPMGGQAGLVRQKPVSNRRMPTRGFKMGSYVRITYRCAGKHGAEEDNANYEGKLMINALAEKTGNPSSL